MVYDHRTVTPSLVVKSYLPVLMVLVLYARGRVAVNARYGVRLQTIPSMALVKSYNLRTHSLGLWSGQ